MNLHPDLSFVAMVVQASVVVQAVMALLLIASLWSWWQIFMKLFALKRAARDTDRFEDDFWKGGDLNELFQRATQNRGGALERVFSSGFREYAKHRRQGTSVGATMDSARRTSSPAGTQARSVVAPAGSRSTWATANRLRFMPCRPAAALPPSTVSATSL